jgi:hypothetical protein
MAAKRRTQKRAAKRTAQRRSRASKGSSPKSRTDTDSITTRARAREGAKGKSGTAPKAKKTAGDGKPATLQEALNSRDANGTFKPGNRLWEARATSGPAPIFADAESLWNACVEYFEWVENNPLYEDQLVTFQGAATHEPIARMRAMTIRSLCRFLDIENSTWINWRRDRPDLTPAIMRVEAVIYTQKFEGAAAGLLNANLVARELGLPDKTEATGKDGEPLIPPAPPIPDNRDVARAVLDILRSAPIGDGPAETLDDEADDDPTGYEPRPPAPKTTEREYAFDPETGRLTRLS